MNLLGFFVFDAQIKSVLSEVNDRGAKSFRWQIKYSEYRGYDMHKNSW